MRKGGNNYINQPVQPSQPVQQGFIGTAINDINNNKDILNPIYDTTATIGNIYNIGTTIIICIIFIIIIIAGVYILNINKDKTENASGLLKDVKCIKETIKEVNSKGEENDKIVNKCDYNIVYKVKGKEYVKKHSETALVNENDKVVVYYEPKNPDNYVIGNNSYIIGLIMIIGSVIVIILSIAWLIFTIYFKPLAAASGANVISDIVM